MRTFNLKSYLYYFKHRQFVEAGFHIWLEYQKGHLKKYNGFYRFGVLGVDYNNVTEFQNLRMLSETNMGSYLRGLISALSISQGVIFGGLLMISEYHLQITGTYKL